MKLTKNYILTRDETSETGLSVHKRHTYEYVGVIGAPFEGEWGWDYEIEGTDSLTDRIVQLEGAIRYGPCHMSVPNLCGPGGALGLLNRSCQ